jgi:competence protein ComEC
MRSWMIGFVPGVTATAFLPSLAGSTLAFFVLAVFFTFVSRRKLIVGLGGLIFGHAVGVLAGNELLDRRLDVSCIGVPVQLFGSVSSLPSRFIALDGSEARRFMFSVESLTPEYCSGPGKVRLSVYKPIDIAVGQRWNFVARLKPPRGYANPGNTLGSTGHVLQGLDAIGHVQNVQGAIRLASSGDVRVLHHRLRHSISEAIHGLPLEPDNRAILQALSVANKDTISDRLWLAFRDLGLSHLLVISGLHVGMVAALAYIFGSLISTVFSRLPVVRGIVPPLAAFICAFSYAALAGFTLPTQRAVFMLVALLAAKVLARNIGAWDRLLLAAVLVLLINPLSVVGAGFWLSFGAVSGLLWSAAWSAQQPEDKITGQSAASVSTKNGGKYRARRLLGGHLYMALTMLPLSVFFFGGSSTVSALANLLAIPLMGFVIVPLVLLGVVLHFIHAGAAELVWLLADWPLRFLLHGVNLATEAQGGLLFAPLQASHGALVLAVSGVALFCVPGRGLQRCLALVFILPLVLAPIRLGSSEEDSTIVSVMDVGQGTAVFIRSGERALLYDTGGGASDGWNVAGHILIPYVQSLGYRSLDSFVVSHGDSDHSAGAQEILDVLQPKRFRHGARIGFSDFSGLPCAAGESWEWPGGQVFTFLSPAPGQDLVSNNTSCVLQLDVSGFRFILAGDIERRQERELVAHWRDKLKTNWLLVPHHGSRTSSSSTFLKFAEPDIAVVSSGFANRFGHPHPDVQSRYTGLGTDLLNTAEDGAVEFEISHRGELSVRRYRNNYRPYWF